MTKLTREAAAARIQEHIHPHVCAILELFKSDARFVLMVRSPELPNGGFIATNDSADEICEAVRRLMREPASLTIEGDSVQ